MKRGVLCGGRADNTSISIDDESARTAGTNVDS